MEIFPYFSTCKAESNQFSRAKHGKVLDLLVIDEEHFEQGSAAFNRKG